MKDQLIIDYHFQSHLVRPRPPVLELLLVDAPPEDPAQPGHRLHPVQPARVTARVLVTLCNQYTVLMNSV